MSGNFPIDLPAIQVNQPLGSFWVVSLRADLLRHWASLDPTRIASVDRKSFLYGLMGNQRDASLTRAKDIGKYINSVESAFPNSIILAANYTDEGPLATEDESRWKVILKDNHAHLHVPSNNKAATVIDGQHRLLGFDYCIDERREMELLCSVYFDLPQAYQAYLFATININQRKVDKSLAYEQFGYNLDDEKEQSWAPDKLAVFFSRKLNLDPDSPFHAHIKLAPLESEIIFPATTANEWQISTACVVEGILTLISSKPKADRDLLHSYPPAQRNRTILSQDSSPLRGLFITGEDKRILDIVSTYFRSARDRLWSIATEQSYIRRTIGVQALFDVLRHLLLKYAPDEAIRKADEILLAAGPINFSHSFYQASGKGRVRVKNVILRAGGELLATDMPPGDAGQYALYAQETHAYR